jgi:hypothetical protein
MLLTPWRCRARPSLDEVAYPVDQPQAMTAAGIGGLPAPPGQRVGDVPAILDLAHHLVGGAPRADDPAARRVTERVGGDLADRQNHVADARRGQPGRLRLAGTELAHRPEPAVEGNRHRALVRRRQRVVGSRRKPAWSEVARVGVLRA